MKINYTILFPLFTIVLIAIGLYFGCQNACQEAFMIHIGSITQLTVSYILKLFYIFILYLLFRILHVLLVQRLFKRLYKSLKVSDRYSRLLKISGFLLWLIFFIIALSIMVGNVSGIVASLGLVGFGLTFGLQKPISNFIGWLTIIFTKTYDEGDRIQIGNIRGDVREIQIMNTVLDGLLDKTDMPSSKIITFPNEMVLTSEVQNFTKESNYIVHELYIDVTYESDYDKAMEILLDVVSKQIKQNKKMYISKKNNQIRRTDQIINKLLTTSTKKLDTNEKEKLEMLQMEKEQIKQQIEGLEEEFVPKIRVELKDSSIQLVAIFMTPYDQIKKTRTEIYLGFLKAIEKIDNISIAYPHVQIVSDKKS